MTTRKERDPQQTTQSVTEYDKSYIGQTGKYISVRILGPRHNLKEGVPEKSKLAQLAYEEGDGAGWGEARIIESNGRYRKYKEAPHMACK
jgi:hypothetical protein